MSEYRERRRSVEARLAEVQGEHRTVAHSELEVIDPLAVRLSEILRDPAVDEETRSALRQLVAIQLKYIPHRGGQ